ncbi:MAG: alpha-glucosidase C-terminal domain-containing protein [Spirochaetaceae bacterium]|nr:alpha-glucosidase C-terminal domain-containing protein [Spirochaetaceae bacterium]
MISIADRVFYHIYPLGMCGTPDRNDFSSPAGSGLRSIGDHIPRLLDMGINALYLGPLFESTAHGYDTLDYCHADRRLGNNEDLKNLVQKLHENGIIVVLDAVLNHTGRHFFAFKDLQERGVDSPYKDWFVNVDFNRQSPLGDRFWYEGWSGHYDLVKLNTANPAVREHLFGAVRFWMEEFGIDGLRLDAADALEPGFMTALSRHCKAIKEDFWLMGEVIHGDYRAWANRDRLDSTTNYELYKGLWSSFNDKNFFEIAWSLNRQSGAEGMYKDLSLYTFVDNHDVNRAASILKNPVHLFPLYGLLFTVPGIPSIYYGSEFGIRGERTPNSDRQLRPAWDFPGGFPGGETSELKPLVDSTALWETIRNCIRIRKETPALKTGNYRQLYVSSEQFAFMRQQGELQQQQQVIVAVNASEKDTTIKIPPHMLNSGNKRWYDLLNNETFHVSRDGCLNILLSPSWLRILEGR